MSTSTVAERLQVLLTDAFQPQVLDVLNESSSHAVPKGSETHFRVIVVSPVFAKMMPIARHRLVYKAVDALMRPTDANPQAADFFHQIHALAIVAKTPEEFESMTNKESILQSPKCLGGEKKERQQQQQR